ncbi:MAG: FtsQ-type POTRA domain-containing protein [Alphaproteobacteria bacterium]|nr:FtsQ-type POTRA domain-containing protein [Alphaproteobacteria bacterium]
MRRIKPWIINSTSALALAGGLIWLAPQLIDVSGWPTVPEQAAESLSAVGLSVEQVLVVGREKTDAADILDALGAVRGAPILDIDVPAAKARISALPWVRSAEITRHLPNSLHITLNEYSAYALWQHEGQYTLIDRDGTAIINVANARPEMPVIVGPDAPDYAAALFAALDEQKNIRHRVKAAVRFGGRRWDVLLDAMDGGITIKLPEKNIASALSGLAVLDDKHQLLSRAVSEIDLRIEGRLVVQLKDGYAPIPQQSRYSPAEREVRTDTRIASDKELPKGV